MLELEDTVALVAGGAGLVGEGIVREFLSRGARVVVPSRETERLAQLRTRLGNPPASRLLTVVGEVSRAEEAERVRQEAERAFGPLQAVVASMGGWWQGEPLTGVSLDTWRQIIDRNLTSHFVLAKALLPGLSKREGASYTFIGGTAAEEAVPNAGLSSIAGAAHLMMSRVLMEEHRNTQVRINLILMGNIHTRKATQAPPDSLLPDEVGTFCAYLASAEGRMVSGGVHRLVRRPPLAAGPALVGQSPGFSS